eukprot:evm.model.scf_1926EXC.1 EVM.evm.TU.scf_1926EXC.1   scf_1926EXC:8610-11578(-)
MVGRTVALAAGGIAAGAIFFCALLIYKLVAARKAEEGGKRLARAEPHVYDSPGHRPSDASSPPATSGHSQPLGRPLPRTGDPESPLSTDRASGQFSSSGDVASRSRDVASQDESVWACPTREPATGEQWSIGANNYVYCPAEFFISGEAPDGKLAQDKEDPEARRDCVGAWVEDPDRAVWTAADDGGDAYDFKVDNPLFAQNPTPREEGGRRCREDSAGGWTPLDPGCATVDSREGGTTDTWAEDSRGGGWRPVAKGGVPAGAGEGTSRGKGGVVDSWAEDSQGGEWNPVERGSVPSGRGGAMAWGRVVDSWAEDSQGGGWKPMERGGTQPGRRDAGASFRSVESWEEAAQGGDWGLRAGGGESFDRREDVSQGQGDRSWAGGGQGGGWRPENAGGQSLGGQDDVAHGHGDCLREEELQRSRWGQEDVGGLPHGRGDLRALGRPPIQETSSREVSVVRKNQVGEAPCVSATWSGLQDDELPVSCSLPADFDFVRKGSGGWGSDSYGSETFAVNLDRSLSGLDGDWPAEHESGQWPLQQEAGGWPQQQDTGAWQPAQAAGDRSPVCQAESQAQTGDVADGTGMALEVHSASYSFTFDLAAVEPGRSLSTIEEGATQEEMSEHEHMCITIFCQAATAPSLKCLPDYCMSEPAPRCPEPQAACSVSSDEWSLSESTSPGKGQVSVTLDTRCCPHTNRTASEPQAAVHIWDSKDVEGGRALASHLFGKPNSYFSCDDQMDGFGDDSGLTGYPWSSTEEIDLCMRSQDAIKRLDGSMWLDTALFNSQKTMGHRLCGPQRRNSDGRQGHAAEVIIM